VTADGGLGPSTARVRSPKKHRSSRSLAFAVLALVSLAIAAGCKRPSRGVLNPAQVHSITREFASAATSAAPTGTKVWIFKEGTAAAPGRLDRVFIDIPSDQQTQAGRDALSRVVRALETVATRRHLTEDPPAGKEHGLSLSFRHEGILTHKVEIVASSRPPLASPGQPRLAIILDDLGNDPASARAVFSLRYALTISVLPNHPFSAQIAEEAHQRGYEVMLHLPMQAIGEEKPEKSELRPGMPANEVQKLAGEMIDAVPFAQGVNNHQGSEATSDPVLMQELMPVLRERGLFYIDSRTSPATVAYETARQDGVQTAFRNVPFLDDVEQLPAIRKQLEIAIRGAREKGSAIAIGHPHPVTIEALSEMLPQARKEGVRLVFASDLVH
jgi:polysaccharide deacetylase 2 family uncharacterized protein YibQ